MKLHSMIPLVLYASALIHAETDGAAPVHPELRRAALSPFTYGRPSPQTLALPPTRDDVQSETVEGDIVVMRKVSITERLDERELRKDILKTRPTTATSDTKYGTGIYEKDFGKIRATAATLVYVPIRVGISW